MCHADNAGAFLSDQKGRPTHLLQVCFDICASLITACLVGLGFSPPTDESTGGRQVRNIHPSHPDKQQFRISKRSCLYAGHQCEGTTCKHKAESISWQGLTVAHPRTAMALFVSLFTGMITAPASQMMIAHQAWGCRVGLILERNASFVNKARPQPWAYSATKPVSSASYCLIKTKRGRRGLGSVCWHIEATALCCRSLRSI